MRRLVAGSAAMSWLPILLILPLAQEATGGGQAASQSRKQEDKGIQLKRGAFYFQIDGKQTFLLGRNPTGWQVKQFAPLLQWASESGEKIVRIHVTTGMRAQSPAGQIDEEWARRWERVFDMADENGLYVLPVLGVWADWNDGSRGEKWRYWHKNRFNAALGGPARSPAELLQDTACRKLWLQWLEELVMRWGKRSNIFGWEVFSELDLITGSSESAALDFMERSKKVIRAADSQSRPITASLAGINEWPRLFASNAVDFVQVHPYADHQRFRGCLGDMIIWSVRERLKRYGKPVFIGECGLDSRGIHNTLVVAPRARIGIKHAIWASAVSGAMNGRMLWWEDGYCQYEKLDLHKEYRDASAAVARFVGGVDFSRFKPIEATESAEVRGCTIGHDRLVLGWFRDVRSAPPNWPVRKVEGQTVTLTVPGAESEWKIEFYDTESCKVVKTLSVQRDGGRVGISLPPFGDSMAFKMFAQSPSRLK